MATSHSTIIQINHANTNLLFAGTTFYSDTGPSAVNVFSGAGSMDRVFLTCTNNGVSGAVVGATGGATNVVIGVTGGQLPATATNDSATTGNVGEYVVSTVAGPGVAMTASTGINMTSISLTAGDWDVSAIFRFIGAASTTVSYAECSISTTSATADQATASEFFANGVTYFGTIHGSGFGVPVVPKRLSLSATTTIYAVAFSNFGASTMSVSGTLRARRVR
jgi:hypothetical protein